MTRREAVEEGRGMHSPPPPLLSRVGQAPSRKETWGLCNHPPHLQTTPSLVVGKQPRLSLL